MTAPPICTAAELPAKVAAVTRELDALDKVRYSRMLINLHKFVLLILIITIIRQ